MSFGFSIGDFLTAISLIRDIVVSLRNSSTASYHELVLELHGLERALQEIEHLKCPPGQEAAVNGVKVAALMCQYPLDEFARKLNKYGSLGMEGGGNLGKREMIKMWSRKLQWGFSMEEETTKLRMYLAAHVGSLNMRLITQGLTSTNIASNKAGEGQIDLKNRIAESHTAISEAGKSVDKYGLVSVSNNWMLKRLSDIISGEISSQLKMLVDIASKVWQSNLQIMTFIVKLQTTTPSPELRYTWVQEPVKLEDALGRVIPIPSEYSWGKLEAVIMEQFSTGPGSEKVSSGEYELFNTLDSSQILSNSEMECLTPGMSITMAIIVGKYGERALDRCPRVGCNSLKITPNEAGGWICCICRAWFDDAQKLLKRPFRPIFFENSPYSRSSYVRHRGSKREYIDLLSDSLLPTAVQMADVYKQRRLERRGYKNLHVHFAELPDTPVVSNVRDQTQVSPQRKRRQRFTSQRTSKRPAIFPLAGWIPPPMLQRPVLGSTVDECLGDAVMLDAFPMQTHPKASSDPNDVPLVNPILDNAHRAHGPLMATERDFWEPAKEPWKEVTEAWKDISEPWKDVPGWLTDLEMDPLTNPLFQSASPTVLSRPDEITFTPTAPSVISEPYWLAMSSTQSVWAAESAPPEFGEHLAFTLPPHYLSIASPQNPRENRQEPQRGGRKPGRRLRPDQRKQAFEMRKIRACLRCRFLKKICDKGDPCAACQPSHARLWQVPCTRKHVKDLDYFMKDWKTDYERRLNLGFTTQNVQGFGEVDRTIFINHGHSASLPVPVRRVFLRDSSYLDAEWTESLHGIVGRFTVPTESLSECGVSSDEARQYIDLHFETNFETVIAHYFKDMPFNALLVQTIYRFYLSDWSPTIRDALKALTGYILTHHISLVSPPDASMAGVVEDPLSKYYSKMMAPAIVNLQIAGLMGDVWRELHKKLLTDLSTYYDGVYSGDKLKHWPKILVLSTVLLIIWEQMQFDSCFHMEDETEASHFCESMEGTPVGAIIGLFYAISQKLPALGEWDAAKYPNLLTSNYATCDMMAQIQEIVNANRAYLISRSQGVEFDKRNFGSLSGKFVSKLLLRPSS